MSDLSSRIFIYAEYCTSWTITIVKSGKYKGSYKEFSKVGSYRGSY